MKRKLGFKWIAFNINWGSENEVKRAEGAPVTFRQDVVPDGLAKQVSAAEAAEAACIVSLGQESAAGAAENFAQCELSWCKGVRL